MSESPDAKFSKLFVALIVVVCMLPAVMSLLGMSFALPLDPSVGGPGRVHPEAALARLGGAFALTILQWSSVIVSLFIAMLAFAHFNIARDVATPIIGTAFLFIGFIDAFQALTASRLINAMAGNDRFIPFAWATSRMMYAVILLFGVGLAAYRTDAQRRRDLGVIPVAAIVLAIATVVLVAYLSKAGKLPQSMFPDRWVTRPYDILPLVVFVVCGLAIFPAFYRRLPSYFSHGLVLSAIPEIGSQLYLIFGSSALYDNNFMVAYVLKFVACLVPLTGLLADYISAYTRSSELERELSQSRDSLRAVLHGVAEPIIATNEQRIILMANDAVSRVLGFKASALIGQPLELILRAADQPSPELFANLETQAAPLFERRWSVVMRHEAGREVHVDAQLSKARVGGRLLLIATLLQAGEDRGIGSGDDFRTALLDAAADESRLPLLAGLERASSWRPSGEEAADFDADQAAHRTVARVLDEAVRFNRLAQAQRTPVKVADALDDALNRAKPGAQATFSVSIDAPVPAVVAVQDAALRLVLDACLRDIVGAAGGEPIAIGVGCEGSGEQLTLQVAVRFSPRRAAWWRSAIDAVSASSAVELSSLKLGTLGLTVAAAAARTIGGGLEVELQGESTGRVSASIPCAELAADARLAPSKPALELQPRVLLVDSSLDHQLVLRAALEAWAVDVRVASDGQHGLDTFVQGAFDWVIVDADLLDTTALSFVEELRRIEHEAAQERTPVVVFSRERRRRPLGELRDLGIASILDKPVDARRLVRMIYGAAAVDG